MRASWPVLLFAAPLAVLPACTENGGPIAELDTIDLSKSTADPCQEDLPYTIHASMAHVDSSHLVYSLIASQGVTIADSPIFVLEVQPLAELAGYSADADSFSGDYTFTVPGATTVSASVADGYSTFQINVSICLEASELQPGEYEMAENPVAGADCLLNTGATFTCTASSP